MNPITQIFWVKQHCSEEIIPLRVEPLLVSLSSIFSLESCCQTWYFTPGITLLNF